MVQKPLRVFLHAGRARRGGALTHLDTILSHLSRMDRYEFTLYAPSSTLAELEVPSAIETHGHAIRSGSLRLIVQMDNVEVRRLARDADVLVSMLNAGPIRSGLPQVLLARNLNLFSHGGTVRERVASRIAVATMNRAEVSVFPSRACRNAAALVGFRGAEEILPHPAPLAVLPPANPALVDLRGPLQILVPSSIQRHKNIGILPAILSSLRRLSVDAVVSVTADDHEIGAVPAGVQVLPRFRRSELGDICHRHDVILIPSLRESFSYPALEFGALGMPLALSDIPAHRELVPDAAFFEVADPEAAAEAVLAAATESLNSRGKRAVRLRTEHDPATYCVRLLGIAERATYGAYGWA